MPINIIDEWADFLQEEKIIDIEYRLATRILEKRTIDKKNQEEKLKDLKNKKAQLIRKAEGVKAFFDRETYKINKFKENLEDVKKAIEREFGKGSVEFKKLEEYEHMKFAITKDIETQKEGLTKSLTELDRHIGHEEEKFL